jgi:hypothetical protein
MSMAGSVALAAAAPALFGGPLHDRCDGHSNTLTVIPDADGMEWGFKGNGSVNSFLHAENSAQRLRTQISVDARQ